MGVSLGRNSSSSSSSSALSWYACDVVCNIFFSSKNIYSDVFSKHILNAQVSIRAPCCKQWFDCAGCHAETQDHQLKKTTEMAFVCKKCKKAFRKDMTNYEESDEYCPHCDNHYVSAMRSLCVPGLRTCVGRSSRQRHRRPWSVSRVRMLGWMHGEYSGAR